MNYSKWTRSELIQRIESLERLNQHLLNAEQEETLLQFGWSGNLGHWYWDVPTNSVTFNPLKVTTLGFTMDEIPHPVTYQFFTSRLHPEDYQRVMDNMIQHLQGNTHVYEVEYRIQAKDGSYKWYYDRGSIIKRDEHGKALFLAGIVFDVTERKQQEMKILEEKEQLEEVVMTDELTKVYNRRGIIEFLKTSITEHDQHQRQLSVVMFDIDDFKKINDTHGHLVGDEILKGVAQIIQRSLRSDDRVGRYGGEEFLVVLNGVNKQKAIRIADRFRQSIAQFQFPNGIKVTVSGGVFEMIGTTLYDLIHQADINLYEAKRKGKNRIIG